MSDFFGRKLPISSLNINLPQLVMKYSKIKIGQIGQIIDDFLIAKI